jgi:hypothetical protein
MNKLKMEGWLHETNFENNHAIITDEDTMNSILDMVFYVSAKIKVVCSMSVTMRIIGKGMKIERFAGDLFPIFANDESLNQSLNYYDNYIIPFSKLALPVNVDIEDNFMIKNSYDCFGLGRIEKPLYIYHSVNDFSWGIMNYVPCIYHLNDVYKLLDKYSESIEIIYKMSIQGLRYVLYALSKLTSDTILSLFYTFSIIDNKLISNINLDDKRTSVPAKFTFDLLNKGYLRFNKDSLINSMLSIDFENLNKEEKLKLINDFVNAFCLIKNDNIDIYSNYVPFVYLTEKENFIIDFTAVFYFFESLFKSGKEYYATLQGDRFNAYVRQRLANELSSNSFVYDNDRNVINNNHESTKIDIIVNIFDTIYIIECKAFEKKSKYFKGHPKEIANRINRIEQAVEQVKRSCKIAEAYIKEKYEIKYKYEWIVCSSDREFIYPLNKYGFLYDKTPKVCTVEEIIEYFNTKIGVK